jgi:RimJ/RimL family protein N-acetyltransferase
MKTMDLPIVFSTGRKTILRPLNKATDVGAITQWVNDPDVQQYVGMFLPETLEQERTWLEKLDNNEKNIVFAIQTKPTKITPSRFIGLIGIHGINWKDRVAETGALIGDKRYWSRGYGTDAKMQVINYAFNALNLHKLTSAAIAYNERSLRYSLHCGYKVEGTRKRQIFKSGEYHDLVILGLFKEDWLPIWKKYQKTGKVK